MSATLGVIKDSFSPVCKFHGVFLQIAHRGQAPTSDEPAFRLLRFIDSKAESAAALRLLEAKLPGSGNILFQNHNQPTLICRDLTRQADADYVLPKIQKMKDDYLDYVRFLDEDFAENRRIRREGQQDEARQRQKEYIERYNQKGWIKFMRARQNIHPDVQVVPGMHLEAEAHSAKLSAPAGKEEASTDETNEAAVVEDNPDYPDAARKKGQRFAAVSMLVDDTDDMEVLLFVHGVYGDINAAKEHVASELNELLHPLPIDVVDMYEWIFPVRMQWENSHASQRVADLDETWNNMELGNTQLERLEAVKKNRKLKQDILKKKEMDAGVQTQIAEHLGITGAQLLQILDQPEHGAEAVIRWVQIDNTEERHAAAAAALVLSLD